MISKLSAARDRLVDAIWASLQLAAAPTASAVSMVRMIFMVLPSRDECVAPSQAGMKPREIWPSSPHSCVSRRTCVTWSCTVGRDGDRDTGPAPGRAQRSPARGPRLPPHLRLPDGPSGRADEGRRGSARSRQPAHHRHLCQAGPGDARDDRPAVARGRTMTGEAWREHLKAYVEFRRALGFTMRPVERLLHDFVAHVERRGDDFQSRRSPSTGPPRPRRAARASVEHRARLSSRWSAPPTPASPCPPPDCFAAADAGPRGSSHGTRSAP